MPNLDQVNNESQDTLQNPEHTILMTGIKASRALDKVLSQTPTDEKRDFRRWGEIGGFCAMLIGAKPVLDTPENWTFGRPLLEKMIVEDPSLKFAFDTKTPTYQFINREALLQAMRQNPDYFPDPVNYDQAKDFFLKTYHLGLDPQGKDPEEFTKTVVQTGLFLGYPKEESKKMAQHIQKGFHEMYELIEFTNPKEVFEKTGISPEHLKILRDYQEVTIHHSKGTLNQNIQKAATMKKQVAEILDQASGIDPVLKEFFLSRQGYLFNQVGWVGYNDSNASIDAMKKIHDRFQATGMKEVLVKHDMVLQGHNISSYLPIKAA
jgi:hypothetical protein